MQKSGSNGALPPPQALQLVGSLLKSCEESADPGIQLWYCQSADQTLSMLKKSVNRTSHDEQDRQLREQIGRAYLQLIKVAAGLDDKLVERSREKVEKWAPGLLKLANQATSGSRRGTHEFATVSDSIFPRNTLPPALPWTVPVIDTPVKDTPELVSCLTLLQRTSDGNLQRNSLDDSIRKWLDDTEANEDEKTRLRNLAKQLYKAFVDEKVKDKEAVAEVVILAPVLSNEDFGHLLSAFVKVLDSRKLLDLDVLAGLAQLIKDAPPGRLYSQSLVQILDIVSKRLQATHNQAKDQVHRLVVIVTNVLNAMADQGVAGLDKVELHEPLLNFLISLWDDSDPYTVYYARTAYQALLCVPDNEPLWKARLKRSSNAVIGILSIAAGINSLDSGNFFDGLERLQIEFTKASQVFQTIREAYTRNDLLTSLKEGFKRKKKEPWYSALRGADEFLQQGRLSDFKRLVCEMSFRKDKWFLWGVCERLGNLAANKQGVWDTKDRQGAVQFLCEIYKDDTMWGSHQDLQKYILDILQQLSLPTIDVPEARASFYELSTNGSEEKQAIYLQCQKAGPGNHHVKTGISRFAMPSMMDRVQGRADVKADLKRWARKKANVARLPSYIPPRAKDNLQASDETAVDLADTVDDFLKSERKVLLLLGDSGVGKTTFNEYLELELWSRYMSRDGGTIPLFISLSAIERPDTDLIPKQLRILNFKESQMRELRGRQFILICDGYDESQQVRNLYTSNKFNKQDEWQAQMIISCRTEYLPSDYQGRFDPGHEGTEDGQSLFQQVVLAPFNDAQIKKYMEKYVEQNSLLWKLSDFERVMDKIPSLQELVKNPYLLSLALGVLPRLADPGQDIEAEKITRVRIYDEFITQWLERNRKKIEDDKDSSHEQKKAFQSLCNDGFVQSGMDFIKDLAVAIFEKQHGKTTVEYSKKYDKGGWKDRFFSLDDEVPILCSACPINRTGNQIQFYHRSILEYGLSLAIFNPSVEQEAFVEEEPSPSRERRGSVSSQFSFEADDDMGDIKKGADDVDLDSPLFKRSYLKERSIIQLLVERVQQDTTGVFKQRLLRYVGGSVETKEWRTAAANAMTILVRAGVCFSHENLKGIRIPGADLSFGVFDATQLQGADLRMTNLQGAWLRQTDLTGARMDGAQFGEWPALNHEKMEGTFAYSPDGRQLMAMTEDGVLLYQTATWNLATLPATLKDEAEKRICTFAFSPDSSLIAAGREDYSIVVWKAKSATMVTQLTGHTDQLRDIAFSPEKGNQFATCSNDGTVRLWDKSPLFQGSGDWKKGRVLSGHKAHVLSVKYDKSGIILASCSSDKTVRIWDLASRVCLHTLEEHSGQVTGISFSPVNSRAYRQLSSFAFDHLIKLWNVDTGSCEHTLKGHKAAIRAVSYSPKGNYIVSASADNTIKVWDTLTGREVATLNARAQVNDVVYSPNGLQIAAACDDNTVRLWLSEDWTTPGPILSGHSDSVTRVSYSPDGFQLASSGWDDSIRLWVSSTSNQQQYRRHRSEVVQVSRVTGGKYILSRCKDSVRIWNDVTGSLRHSLPNHKMTVMAISPCGLQFATACTTDNIVRLWEPQSGQCKHMLEEHKGHVTDIAYSSEGYRLATGCNDGTVRIWSWREGNLRHRLVGRNKGTHLLFSPSGGGLLAVVEDNIVQLWNAESGEHAHRLIGNHNAIEKIAFSLEGDLITTAAVDGSFRTWSTQTGNLTGTLHHGFATPSLITPDASKGVMVSPTGQLGVYDVLQKKRLWELPSSGGRAVVALSPDARLLIHSAKEGLLHLWDITNGKPVGQFKTLTTRITSLDWSQVEGTMQTKITVGHEEGDVSVWSMVEATPDSTTNVATSPQQKYDLLLLWTSANKKLNLENMSVQNVKDLSSTNARLLKQNGALGVATALWKVTQKVIAMNNVITSLRNATPTEE